MQMVRGPYSHCARVPASRRGGHLRRAGGAPPPPTTPRLLAGPTPSPPPFPGRLVLSNINSPATRAHRTAPPLCPRALP